MKKIYCLCILISVCTVKADNRPTVAVFDFKIPGVRSSSTLEVNDGDRTLKIEAKEVVTTEILTESFITAITKSKKFIVVERNKLDTLLGEHEFGDSEITDPKKSINAGKMLGAELMLFGSLDNIEVKLNQKPIPYSSRVNKTCEISISVSMRMVDAKTGQIRAARSESISYSSKLDSNETITGKHLINARDLLVSTLTQMLIDEIFPIKIVHVKDDVLYVNQGGNSGVEIGDKFEIYRTGEEITDPDTGVNLGVEQTHIGTAIVSRVDALMSFARMLKSESPTISNPIKGDICKFISKGTAEIENAPESNKVDKIFK